MATPDTASAAIRARAVIPWTRRLPARDLPPRAPQDRLAMCSTDTATSRNPQVFSSLGPSCVHAGVRPLLIALGFLVWTGAGCGRTALEPIYKDNFDAA